jgi:hypothetical protein
MSMHGQSLVTQRLMQVCGDDWPPTRSRLPSPPADWDALRLLQPSTHNLRDIYARRASEQL